MCTLLLVSPVSAESLYNEAEYEALTSDGRSFKVGDILTVMIYETATASTQTNTETSKSTSLGVSATDGTTDFSGKAGINSDFDGGGRSNQTGKLVASVSVSVVEKKANGDMLVKGRQTLEFNNDTQYISVEGVVREKDVTASNTVLSSRLAEANIKFTGEGLLSSRAEPGIITRFWNWLF